MPSSLYLPENAHLLAEIRQAELAEKNHNIRFIQHQIERGKPWMIDYPEWYKNYKEKQHI